MRGARRRGCGARGLRRVRRKRVAGAGTVERGADGDQCVAVPHPTADPASDTDRNPVLGPGDASGKDASGNDASGNDAAADLEADRHPLADTDDTDAGGRL